MASLCRSLQCLLSTLTQAGGGGLLFRFASSVTLRGGRGTAFPVYAAQAPSCSIWSMPCAARSSSPRVFHKSADLAAPVSCAFPGPSSLGSQELDGRTLPGCGAPSPLRCPSLSFRLRQSGVRAFSPLWPQPQSPPVQVGCVRPGSSRDPQGGCRSSRISGSLWLETGGLLAVW